MTGLALRPDASGARSGSGLLFSNGIRVHFAGIGGVGRSGADPRLGDAARRLPETDDAATRLAPRRPALLEEREAR